MRNRLRNMSPLIMFVVGSLFTLAVVGGSPPAQNDTIEACVNDNGEMRIVDTVEGCTTNETPLSWNASGPVAPRVHMMATAKPSPPSLSGWS